MTKIIITLVFAHFLLDWSLQDETTKHYKQESWFVLGVHCIIWSFGLALVLMWLDLWEPWKLVMLFVGHYLMDYWKCRRKYKSLGISDMTSLYIDQAFHLGQLGLCLLQKGPEDGTGKILCRVIDNLEVFPLRNRLSKDTLILKIPWPAFSIIENIQAPPKQRRILRSPLVVI